MHADAVHEESISEGFAVSVYVNNGDFVDGAMTVVTVYLSLAKAAAHIAAMQAAMETAQVRIAAKAAAQAVLDGTVTP